MKKILKKRIYKYVTGDVIPEGAIYLGTVTQTQYQADEEYGRSGWDPCWLVWHYFLVETTD